jgi:hypothetical protein
MKAHPCRRDFASALAVAALFLFARYLPHPAATLVADDWPNLARAESYPDAGTAFRVGLQDPNRPVSMAVLDVVFRAAGTRAWPFTAISIAGNLALLLIVMRLAMELSGRRAVAIAAGICFALLPNVYETTHWSTQVVNEVACALVGYAASAWLFARWARSGGWPLLAGSVASYAVALFSYEAGLFLPASYVLLMRERPLAIRNLLRLAPFGVAMAAYAAWRATNAFGMNHYWHYPAHMQAGVSAYALAWNAWQFAHWWAGEHLIEAVLAGWNGFMQLGPWTRRMLLLLNAAAVYAAIKALRATQDEEPSGPRAGRPAAFALAWIAASMLPLLISYTASRLNVLPGIGVALSFGLLLGRRTSLPALAALAVPMWIAMAALQGTTEQFRQAGEFNRRLYAHLEATQAEWRDKIAIVFDTRGIRERQARRLIGPAGEHERTWAQYGNALLFRGFVPRGMVERIAGDRRVPVQIVHDVENGARLEAGAWRWHARFDPSRSVVAPEDAVFYVNLLDVAR